MPSKGFALIELVIALAVLASAVVGIASLFAAAATSTEVETHLSQDAVLCQSKMEELHSLSFTDTSTDTTTINSSGQFPTTGGTGLSAGGSTTTPTSGYADYMDASGNHLTSASGAIYTRMWQIQNITGANAAMKTVNVTCADDTLSRSALNPSVALVTSISQ